MISISFPTLSATWTFELTSKRACSRASTLLFTRVKSSGLTPSMLLEPALPWPGGAEAVTAAAAKVLMARSSRHSTSSAWKLFDTWPRNSASTAARCCELASRAAAKPLSSPLRP